MYNCISGFTRASQSSRYIRNTIPVKRVSTLSTVRRRHIHSEPSKYDKVQNGFVTQSADKDSVAQIGTLVVHDPRTVRAEQLLDEIFPPQEVQLRDLKIRSCSSAVFVLTPAFAKWLNDDERFLKKAAERLLQIHTDGPSPHSIDIVSCVVDRVVPQRYDERQHDVSQSESLRSAVKEEFENGCEGLAYCFTSPPKESGLSSDIRPDDIEQRKASDFGHTSVAFHFTKSSIASHTPPEQGQSPRKLDAMTVGISLANTIFYTGTETYLRSSRWSIVPNGQTKAGVEGTDLKSHDKVVLQWPWMDSFGHSNSQLSLHLPLTCLTPFRQIVTGAGNVIRQITGSDSSDAAAPASRELEVAIPRFLRSKPGIDGPVSVFALIVPQSLYEASPVFKTMNTVSISSTDDEVKGKQLIKAPSTEEISSLLDQGAVLRRVLSGGGGWGQKAGLLSIDWQPTIRATETSSSEFEESWAAAFGRCFNDGDYVQFLVADCDLPMGNVLFSKSSSPSLVFGTSGTSNEYQDGIATMNHFNDQNIEHFRQHLGLLSSHGIQYSFSSCTDDEKQTSTFETASKIDVPASRFSIQTTVHASPSNRS